MKFTYEDLIEWSLNEISCKSCKHNKDDPRYNTSKEYKHWCSLKNISKNNLRGCVRHEEID